MSKADLLKKNIRDSSKNISQSLKSFKVFENVISIIMVTFWNFITMETMIYRRFILMGHNYEYGNILG